MAVVSTISHFLYKNVCRISFARDMENIWGVILNPFTDRVFLEFNVSGSFGGHVVRPFYTCIVVVIYDSK